MFKFHAILLLIFSACISVARAGDTLILRGQVSIWGNYNPSLELPYFTGARYIPQLNYNRYLKERSLLDFECSMNSQYTASFHPFDSLSSDVLFKPYRVWVRYSTSRLEVRAGLQKINFGSATMLRPLMWFDRMDPRDPLQLTDGIWGILGRYYLLNNGNIWLWGLWGNDDSKTWEVGKTTRKVPEAGWRIQYPVPRGEAALTYHFRVADTRSAGPEVTLHGEIPEHRAGLDAKWDIGPGVWIEGSLISKTRDIGPLTNQMIMAGGTDYTFGLGNGLTMIFEHLVYVYDRKLMGFSNSLHITGLSLSYPFGLFDHASGMVFFDWQHHATYSFLTWKKQFKHITIYLMVYWNPSEYNLPQMSSGSNLFGGKGIQAMAVYNH